MIKDKILNFGWFCEEMRQELNNINSTSGAEVYIKYNKDDRFQPYSIEINKKEFKFTTSL